MDEPDVHLHPDLQARLMDFLVELIEEFEFDIVIATHSTPILGELVETLTANVCLMAARQKSLSFEPVDDIYKKLIPVFGAHPLTRVFSNWPTLLVEGEDDVRIWQSAMRSAAGAVRLYPVECGGLPFMKAYEDRLARVMVAVYDGAVAYSLRDRDDNAESIEDIPPVIRIRLSCRAAENLLFSDEVIASVSLNWMTVESRISEWCTQNPTHPRYASMQLFLDEGLQRKSADLKDVRMILVGQILASNKPWEILVGQVIAQFSTVETADRASGPTSLQAFLGNEVVERLLPGPT